MTTFKYVVFKVCGTYDREWEEKQGEFDNPEDAFDWIGKNPIPRNLWNDYVVKVELDKNE